MRIAIGGIIHETSTYVDTATTLRDFEYDRGVIRSAEMIERFRGTNVCTGGFIDGADKHGFELVPLLRASAFPGGLIRHDDYDALKSELLQRLLAAGEVDGVLLDLHGAMVVEGIHDGDGDLIEAVRELVGERPIVVTQDLHGNHTRRRVAAADALVGFDTFPHVDMAERGREAADVIVRAVQEVIRPTMAISTDGPHAGSLVAVTRRLTSKPNASVVARIESGRCARTRSRGCPTERRRTNDSFRRRRTGLGKHSSERISVHTRQRAADPTQETTLPPQGETT